MPISALTIILIGIFAAALAFGLLFLLRTRKHAHQAAAENEPQGRAVNFFFSRLISLYKWAFSYNIRPTELAATNIVSEEPRTGIVTPPQPEPVIQPTESVPLPGPTLPESPAPAVTAAPTTFTSSMSRRVQTPSPVPVPLRDIPASPLATAMPARPAAIIATVTQDQSPAPAPTSQSIPPASRPKATGRPYGLQAIIDIMGDGIEIAFARMSDGIVFIFDGFINLFKWIFRIDR